MNLITSKENFNSNDKRPFVTVIIEHIKLMFHEKIKTKAELSISKAKQKKIKT